MCKVLLTEAVKLGTILQAKAKIFFNMRQEIVDGSPDSKLPLHASHVALPNKFIINIINCVHVN
jgi:hypothetical protein